MTAGPGTCGLARLAHHDLLLAVGGDGGYQDSFFYTDGSDGAMTFWAPEHR